MKSVCAHVCLAPAPSSCDHTHTTTRVHHVSESGCCPCCVRTAAAQRTSGHLVHARHRVLGPHRHRRRRRLLADVTRATPPRDAAHCGAWRPPFLGEFEFRFACCSALAPGPSFPSLFACVCCFDMGGNCAPSVRMPSCVRDVEWACERAGCVCSRQARCTLRTRLPLASLASGCRTPTRLQRRPQRPPPPPQSRMPSHLSPLRPLPLSSLLPRSCAWLSRPPPAPSSW